MKMKPREVGRVYFDTQRKKEIQLMEQNSTGSWRCRRQDGSWGTYAHGALFTARFVQSEKYTKLFSLWPSTTVVERAAKRSYSGGWRRGRTLCLALYHDGKKVLEREYEIGRSRRA